MYHDVHSAELARRAAGAGADGLNLLNDRMGGQTGALPALQFLEEVKSLNLDVPLICAGGIGNEGDFATALEQGYSGVQMGTRFIATHECKVTQSYKNAIVKATASDIVLTNKLAGTESSVIRTPMIEEGGLRANMLLSFFLRQPLTKSLARMFLLQRSVEKYKKATTDESVEIWQAGKGVTNIHAVESVEEVLNRFASEFEKR